MINLLSYLRLTMILACYVLLAMGFYAMMKRKNSWMLPAAVVITLVIAYIILATTPGGAG